MDEGGLAGAARAHDGDAPPRLEAEAHSVEREAGLARVGEPEAAHLQHPRGPARAGPLGSTTRGSLVRRLEEPARRLAREGEARPRRGQAGHRLERGEGEEGHDGQVDAVEVSRADRGDREGEDRDRGQVGAESGERTSEGGGPRETLLLPHCLAAAHRPDCRREVGLPPEGEHVRQPLHAVHQPGRELSAEPGEASAGRRRETTGEPGEGRGADREPGDGHRRRRRAEGQQREPHEPHEGDRGKPGTDDAHVEGLEGRHVLDNPAEEVAAAGPDQTGGGEGHQVAIDRDPQPRQQPQRHVVRREPAPGSAASRGRRRRRGRRPPPRRSRRSTGWSAAFERSHAEVPVRPTPAATVRTSSRTASPARPRSGGEERDQAAPPSRHRAPSHAARSRG